MGWIVSEPDSCFALLRAVHYSFKLKKNENMFLFMKYLTGTLLTISKRFEQSYF